MSATAVSQIGGEGYVGQAVFTATADPTAQNDINANHKVGDTILNTTSGIAFVCVSNTANAAVWRTLNTSEISYTVTANSGANNLIYTAPRACQVLAILARVETATGGAATATAVKAANGTAVSAGTALHTGSVNLQGTAATNQTLTLAAAGTLALNAGDSIGVQTTGTLTGSQTAISILLLQS